MERAAAGEDKSYLSSRDYAFYRVQCVPIDGCCFIWLEQTGHLSIYTNIARVELQQAAIRFLLIVRQ